jgi:hypothetical protein
MRKKVFQSRASLRAQATALRRRFESAFAPETAIGKSVGSVPSSGHCAAVATLVFEELGGSLVSAYVSGQSHWFNRIAVGGNLVDVDLTGDQFGRDAVQVADAGSLYKRCRIRSFDELDSQTRIRAAALRSRVESALSGATV